MIKVLWISRHEMTGEQFADLESVLGGRVEITRYTETLKDAADVSGLISGSDAVAAVLPAEMMAQVLDLCEGRPLLQAVSERVATGRTLTLDDGRTEQEFRFVHRYWELVVEISIRTEKMCGIS